MLTNPTEVVTALAKILEGWAAMQESQASAQAEQLEALRVQAGLQTQALVQLAGGGEAALAAGPAEYATYSLCPKDDRGGRRPSLPGGV